VPIGALFVVIGLVPIRIIAASPSQAAPLINQCADIASLLDAMSELNKRWFEVIPDDVMQIWPVDLQPDSVCGTSDTPCLQYESTRAVRLDDGSPLCHAFFNWSATHADPMLNSIILRRPIGNDVVFARSYWSAPFSARAGVLGTTWTHAG
jgi:hypothetical protein